MGLTKDYLRYVPAGNFNIISSARCNAVFVALQCQMGRFIAVGACEHIIIWDLRLGEKAQVLPGERATVTSLCANPNNKHLAAGYSDGNVQIYDLKTAEVVSVFAGHRGEVTALTYNERGHRLASGSQDTDVIVWDTVAEVGLYRFSGHKGGITQLKFMIDEDILISASKDTFVKFWDLSTQHCFKTITGNQGEVWDIALVKNDQYLVTGCRDKRLRIFKLSKRDEKSTFNLHCLATAIDLADNEGEADDPTHHLQCIEVDSILRESNSRLICLVTDLSGQILASLGIDNKIELFHFREDEEVLKHFKKRLKKQNKDQNAIEITDDTVKKEEKIEDDDKSSKNLILEDVVKRYSTISLPGKATSIALVFGSTEGKGELRIGVNFKDNSIRLFSLQTSIKNAEVICLRGIVSQGHHTDVYSVAFSSDSLALVSGGGDGIKLWNVPTLACIRTVEAKHILSVSFVPGDKHILAGLKSGSLLIIDVAVGDILEEIPAHSSNLKTILIMPDLCGCITAGGDETVKFWQFELITDEKSTTKVRVLSLLHKRTLKTDKEIITIRISPNNKFIAVSLIDFTVKIFFVDSFKFYLSLYGHKLPVTCMDISSDSKLIATGSGDRNIKIWGLDYGDCHRSLFAHEDTVTGLQFVPNSHLLFSCGKDGKVKHWDADKFNKILTLPGHAGEALTLSLSSNEQYVITSGTDKVLRLYEKSEQILVLEDEEEEEREAIESEAVNAADRPVLPTQVGLSLPSKRTIGTEKAAESIIECIEVCEKYKQELAEAASSSGAAARPAVPLIMTAYNVSTCNDFLLITLKRIRSSDLKEALFVLPFDTVCTLMTMLPDIIQNGNCVELTCKVAIFLLKLHNAPIISNKMLWPVIKKLETVMKEAITDLRDKIGYNFIGLSLLQDEIREKEGVQLFRESTMAKKKREKTKQLRETYKRSHAVLHS